jgi:hypothetical protein
VYAAAQELVSHQWPHTWVMHNDVLMYPYLSSPLQVADAMAQTADVQSAAGYA